MPDPAPKTLSLVSLLATLVVLRGGVPALQLSSGVAGGWVSSWPLLAVFLVLPVAAGFLVHRGQVRVGAILLLAMLAAGAYADIRVFTALPGTAPSPGDSGFAFHALRGALVLSIIVQAIGVVVAAAMIDRVHKQNPVQGNS